MTESTHFTAAELFSRARRLWDDRQYEQAEIVLRQAVTVAPGNPDYLAWLARTVAAHDDTRMDEAQMLAERALQIEPTTAIARFVLGRVALARGDTEGARKYFDQSLAADPMLRAAYWSIHDMHCQKYEWQLAFPPFLRYHAPSLCILETDALRWLKLTEAAWENENYGEVYQYASRILEADPDCWLGWCYKSLAAPHVSTPNHLRLQELQNGLKRVFATYGADAAEIDWLCTLGSSGTLSLSYKLRDGFVQQQEDYVGLHAQPVRDTRIQTNVGAAFGQGIANGIAENMEAQRQREAAARQIGQRFTQDYQEPIISALETCWALGQPAACADNICYSVEAVTNAGSLSWQAKRAYRDRIAPLLLRIRSKNPDRVDAIPILEEEKQSGGGCGCSPCFVATAVMGDFDHPVVLTLRQYRDRILLRSLIGRAFVRTYYCVSPPLARWIARSDRRRAFFYRMLIRPMARMAGQRLAMDR